MTRLDELQNLVSSLPTDRSRQILSDLLDDLESVTRVIGERARCPRCESCANAAEALKDHLYVRYQNDKNSFS